MKYLIKTAIILALTLVLTAPTGCRTANTYSREETRTQRNVIDDKRIVSDPLLNLRAQVVEITETVTPSGFSKVQVEVLNKLIWRKKFEYKFEWFDGDGNLIDSTSDAYQVKEILGREKVYLTATAPTRDAKDFQLKLIRTRR